MSNKRNRSLAFVERPSIDFVMLANHAEALNGLLYMLGGGWTDHRRIVIPGQPPPASAFSIALSISTPWNDTNRPINLKVAVETDDGSELFKMETTVTAGRSPQLAPGSAQHAPLAINAVVPFPKPGGYRVVVRLDGRDSRTWPFRVHDINQQQLAS